MQPDVHPNVVLDLNRDLGRAPVGTLVTFLGLFRPFYVRPDDVLARGHQLLKFAHMVGVNLPAGFLFAGAAYPDANSIHRPVITVPNRPEDQPIMFFVVWLIAGGGGGSRPHQPHGTEQQAGDGARPAAALPR